MREIQAFSVAVLAPIASQRHGGGPAVQKKLSCPMSIVVEDLGGGGGEVVEGNTIALAFARLCRFRKN
ncbi:hypothetical protein OAO39_03660 [Pirellulaceae bacterium]|nr:hypothetical protein [Pirellulaceae bacterium]